MKVIMFYRWADFKGWPDLGIKINRMTLHFIKMTSHIIESASSLGSWVMTWKVSIDIYLCFSWIKLCCMVNPSGKIPVRGWVMCHVSWQLLFHSFFLFFLCVAVIVFLNPLLLKVKAYSVIRTKLFVPTYITWL